MTLAHSLVGVLVVRAAVGKAGLRGGRFRVIGTPYTRRGGKGRGLSCRDGRMAGWGVRRGFNLVELVVVLAVAVVLTGLMMPAMSRVRENLHRIMCSSHLHQLSMPILIYASEHEDRLPHTVLLDDDFYQPQELMAVYLGDLGGDPAGWDGLGLLYSKGYCTAPGVFYCPSHTGDHPSERYHGMWEDAGSEIIYSNYQYAGHLKWDDPNSPVRFIDDARLVIATDGLRTSRDFNHETGMNVLSGDGSVIWRDDNGIVYANLPQGLIDDPAAAEETYRDLWRTIEDMNHR